MALILAGFALIALIDLVPVIRRRSGHTAAAFLLFFVPALALAVLQAQGVELPSAMILLWKALHALGLNY